MNIVLFNGGISSLSCLLHALSESSEVVPLYLNFNYQEKELETVRKLLSEFDIEPEIIHFQKSFELPENLKELVLIINAIPYANSDTNSNIIYYKKTKSEISIGEYLKKHRINLVQIRGTKGEMVKHIVESGFVNLLKYATSCKKDRDCGLCEDCFKKFIALHYAGIDMKENWQEYFVDNPAESYEFVDFLVNNFRECENEKEVAETMSVAETLGIIAGVLAVDFNFLVDNPKNVEKTNRFYENGWLILVHDAVRPVFFIKNWLDEHKVRYHRIAKSFFYTKTIEVV